MVSINRVHCATSVNQTTNCHGVNSQILTREQLKIVDPKWGPGKRDNFFEMYLYVLSDGILCGIL